MPETTNDCPHATTAELAFGIFKCTACGELFDEGSEYDLRRRRESQPNAEQRERRKQAIIKAQRRKKGNHDNTRS